MTIHDLDIPRTTGVYAIGSCDRLRALLVVVRDHPDLARPLLPKVEEAAKEVTVHALEFVRSWGDLYEEFYPNREETTP